VTLSSLTLWSTLNSKNRSRYPDKSISLSRLRVEEPTVGDANAGPTKNELKKRQKALEKEQKAAERAAKQQELAAQKAAAEVVRPTRYRWKQWPTDLIDVGLRD
jgi:hypothetical protein